MYGSDLLRFAKIIALGAALMAFPAMAQAQTQSGAQKDFPGARLKALNKLTTKLETLDIEVDQQVKFGSLTITLRACRKPASAEEDDSVAFLEINDRTPDGTISTEFSGWMFASSPSLSGLEHPLYDVWVESCTTP